MEQDYFEDFTDDIKRIHVTINNNIDNGANGCLGIGVGIIAGVGLSVGLYKGTELIRYRIKKKKEKIVKKEERKEKPFWKRYKEE